MVWCHWGWAGSARGLQAGVQGFITALGSALVQRITSQDACMLFQLHVCLLSFLNSVHFSLTSVSFFFFFYKITVLSSWKSSWNCVVKKKKKLSSLSIAAYHYLFPILRHRCVASSAHRHPPFCLPKSTFSLSFLHTCSYCPDPPKPGLCTR